MIKLPSFSPPKLNLNPLSQVWSFLNAHKILIIIGIVLVGFVVAALQFRGYSLSKLKTAQTNGFGLSDFFQASAPNTDPLDSSSSALPSPSDTSVLGVSNDSSGSQDGSGYTAPVEVPATAPSDTPSPTPVETTVTTDNSSSSSSSCDGTPTAYNSEAVVSASTTQVNSAVTINIDLLDCNNNTPSVNDNLTVTLTSGDSATTINGSASPVNIQAQNGKASFSVNSPNPTTATFTVYDNNHSFAVTDPHNKNPSVTFGNSASCAGTPTAFNSEAISSGTSSDGSGNIAVELLDCNNNYAAVSDTLTLSLSSTDSTLTVNGSAPSASMQAANGKAVFSLHSQINGTDTFVIQDTTQNFTVTDPHNHNPTLTFNNAAATPSPTPTPSTSPAPSAASSSSPTPTPSVSPSFTPRPTASPH